MAAYVRLFGPVLAKRGDGSIMLPFTVWRETFINDVDLETAQKANGWERRTFSMAACA
jgi:hypothetical protein